MSELEEYKEEKPEQEIVVVENETETPKKKKMTLTTKIFIGLIIFVICLVIFKFSYKPKTNKFSPVPELTPDTTLKSNSYDLKTEVSKFLQKQVEYIL